MTDGIKLSIAEPESVRFQFLSPGMAEGVSALHQKMANAINMLQIMRSPTRKWTPSQMRIAAVIDEHKDPRCSRGLTEVCRARQRGMVGIHRAHLPMKFRGPPAAWHETSCPA